jgi:U2 small nuclear ribonucleoprotein A'
VYSAHIILLGRQHYRLYAIYHIPSLKVLDWLRVTPSERDKSHRLAQSAAGAALESDVQQEAAQQQRTFTPGEGQSAAESFQTLFTAEQKEKLRHMVANAKSPQEIEQIEASVQKGIFPVHLLPKCMASDGNDGDDSRKKRPAEETNGTDKTKKPRT